VSCPKLVLAELLTRIEAVYGKPLHAEQLLEAWHRVLGRYQDAEVTAAVDVYIEGDHRWFPKPGMIRKLIAERQRQHPTRTGSLAERARNWERGGGIGAFEPCPVCAAVLAPDPLTGRLRVHHDHQRHYEAGIAYSGPRTGPVEFTRGLPAMRPSTWQPAAAPPEAVGAVSPGLPANAGDAYELPI
jgi:hypothetical protein